MFKTKKITSTRHSEFANPQMIFSMCYNLLKSIDEKTSSFNLKISYYMYKLLKYRKKPNYYIAKVVMTTLLRSVGSYSVNLDKGNNNINSYLILKYFSPLKKESKILLYQDRINNISKSKSKKMGTVISMLTEFEKYKIASNFKAKEVKKCGFNSSVYPYYKYRDFTNLINDGIIDIEIKEERMLSEISLLFKDNKTSKLASEFLSFISYFFEMYNNDTLEHSRSTAIIAAYLAYKMHLGKRVIKKMYIAGLVHDMGKLMIDKKILEKPSKLNDEEYEIMKKHVEYSKDILSYYFNNEIVTICYRHHEKLDGTGYPNKLTNDDLTIEDKILQVSDIISALLISRCYKVGFTNDEIIKVLNEEVKLNHLDSEVVECFIKHNKAITKIAKVPIIKSKALLYQMQQESKIIQII